MSLATSVMTITFKVLIINCFVYKCIDYTSADGWWPLRVSTICQSVLYYQWLHESTKGSHTEITPKHTDIRKDRKNKSPLYLIQHTGDSNRKPDSHPPHYDLLVNCPNYRELARVFT